MKKTQKNSKKIRKLKENIKDFNIYKKLTF